MVGALGDSVGGVVVFALCLIERKIAFALWRVLGINLKVGGLLAPFPSFGIVD